MLLVCGGGPQPEFRRTRRRLGSGPASELRKDVPQVHVDGAGAQDQAGGDLAVREPRGDEADHLHLTTGEPARLVLGGRPPPEMRLARLAQLSDAAGRASAVAEPRLGAASATAAGAAGGSEG